MADFVQSANVKSATRTLAEPIADVATFNTIVQSVITDNPFECVAYMTAGESHPPVEKTKEGYTAKLVYQDTDAKTVGTGSHKFNTLAGFNAGVTALLAAATVSTAHGGTMVDDIGKDAFSKTKETSMLAKISSARIYASPTNTTSSIPRKCGSPVTTFARCLSAVA